MTQPVPTKTKSQIARELRVLKIAFYYMMLMLIGVAAYFYFIIGDADSQSLSMVLLLFAAMDYTVLQFLVKKSQEKMERAPLYASQTD
jgi:hypothetical protein